MAQIQKTIAAETSKVKGAPAQKAAPKAAPAAKAAAKVEAKEVVKAAPAKAAQKVAAKPEAKAKADTQPAAKVEAKPAPVVKAGGAKVITMIVKGIAQRIEQGSRFYARALSYHKDAGTVFPRARNNETRATLTEDDVTEIFRQHDAKILAAGSGKAQAMFDVYMMGAASK